MIKKTLVALSVVVLVTGCSTQTFYVKDNGNGGVQTQEDMQAFFVNGIGQEQKVDAAATCGGQDKVAKVQVEQTFLDGFLGVISFGIYTPRHARVYCDNG